MSQAQQEEVILIKGHINLKIMMYMDIYLSFLKLISTSYRISKLFFHIYQSLGSWKSTWFIMLLGTC